MGNVELSVFIGSSLVYDILIHISEQGSGMRHNQWCVAWYRKRVAGGIRAHSNSREHWNFFFESSERYGVKKKKLYLNTFLGG